MIEEVPINDLVPREDYWMSYYQSLNPVFGYNVNYPATKDGWACSTTRKTVLGALGLLTEAPLGWLIASK